MRIGFIGLGAMGRGMAGTLLAAGHHVAHDGNAERGLVEAEMVRGVPGRVQAVPPLR